MGGLNPGNTGQGVQGLWTWEYRDYSVTFVSMLQCTQSGSTGEGYWGYGCGNTGNTEYVH